MKGVRPRAAAGPPGWTVAEDRGARATDCTEDAAAVTAAVPARRRLVRACALNRAGGWAGRDSDWTSRGRAIFPRKHTPLRREEPRPAQTAAPGTRLRPLARRRGTRRPRRTGEAAAPHSGPAGHSLLHNSLCTCHCAIGADSGVACA